MLSRISAGCEILDKLLEGGYETDTITIIYGPAGSGKTNLCMLPIIRLAGSGKKTLYIDTEGGFSTDRLSQITKHYKKVLENIIFFHPITFEEQSEIIFKLNKLLKNDIGLIIVDSISMLYRLELGKAAEISLVNAQLSQQIAALTEIARIQKIPVLLTNQVYADFQNKDRVSPVGGDLLRYGSKCLIELQPSIRGLRVAIIRKHRSIESDKTATFRIVKEGIAPIKEQPYFSAKSSEETSNS